MITEEQLALAEADWLHIELRVSIGPSLKYMQQSIFQAGEPIAMPRFTSLTAPVTANSTSLHVESAVGVPTIGTAVVESAEAGQVGRYSYTGATPNQLSGINLLSGSAYHDTGAVVYFLNDISDKVTSSPTLHHSIEAGVIDWSMSMSGQGFNSLYMKPNCSVIFEYRTASSLTTPTQMALWFIGFAQGWDVDSEGFWDVKINSIKYALELHQVESRIIGRRNIAPQCNMSSSGDLKYAWLEPQEYRLSGTPPTLERINDEGPTGWISDFAP